MCKPEVVRFTRWVVSDVFWLVVGGEPEKEFVDESGEERELMCAETF